MSATGDRAAADAGETLLEALAVVAIVGLIAAIAFPRLQQGLLVLSQHQAAAVLTARVREARALALGADAPVVFAIGGDGRSYAATGGAVTRTPSGVILAAAPARTIAFYGDGSSSGGVIRIRAGSRAMSVIITRAGGAVALSSQ